MLARYGLIVRVDALPIVQVTTEAGIVRLVIARSNAVQSSVAEEVKTKGLDCNQGDLEIPLFTLNELETFLFGL